MVYFENVINERIRYPFLEIHDYSECCASSFP